MLEREWRKGNPLTLLVGMYISATPMETSMEVLKKLKTELPGVPVVAQWLMNPTRNHDVADSTPGLAQWVKDRSLP